MTKTRLFISLNVVLDLYSSCPNETKSTSTQEGPSRNKICQFEDQFVYILARHAESKPDISAVVRCVSGMSNLASKFGQIGSKWDKSGTF